MEGFYRFKEQNHSESKLGRIALGIGILIILFLLVAGFSYSNLQIVNPEPSPQPITPTNLNQIVPKASSTPVVNHGIKMLYPTKENGRIWYAKWSGEKAKTLKSGERDASDSEFVARGNGTISIDGKGIASLIGDTPRMYVFDPEGIKKWNNVEVTLYAKRISESGLISSQGIIIGARSEHQDATIEKPCFGATYYGRLLYDGRAVFQKEIIHEGSYSTNKPKENNMTTWNTTDGTMPRNMWIGMKFIVKTNPDGKSVKLELYRDLTDGKDGGIWEKLAEYTDDGNWSQINSGTDVLSICGYPANKVLLNPSTSVFVRNDEVTDVEYKLFSIREIQ